MSKKEGEKYLLRESTFCNSFIATCLALRPETLQTRSHDRRDSSLAHGRRGLAGSGLRLQTDIGVRDQIGGSRETGHIFGLFDHVFGHIECENVFVGYEP